MFALAVNVEEAFVPYRRQEVWLPFGLDGLNEIDEALYTPHPLIFGVESALRISVKKKRDRNSLNRSFAECRCGRCVFVGQVNNFQWHDTLLVDDRKKFVHCTVL